MYLGQAVPTNPVGTWQTICPAWGCDGPPPTPPIEIPPPVRAGGCQCPPGVIGCDCAQPPIIEGPPPMAPAPAAAMNWGPVLVGVILGQVLRRFL